MEQALRTILLNDSGVSSRVGTRVDWGSRPQGQALPAVAMIVVSGSDAPHLEGTDELEEMRVQVDCYGSDYAEAKFLSRAVIGALNGHSDSEFRGVFHDSTRDSREGGSNEADRPYRVSLDFTLHHRST